MDPTIEQQLHLVGRRAAAIYAKAFRRHESAMAHARTPDAIHEADENLKADKRTSQPWYQIQTDMEWILEELPKLSSGQKNRDFEFRIRSLFASFLMTHGLATERDYPDMYDFLPPQPEGLSEPPGGYFGEISQTDFD